MVINIENVSKVFSDGEHSVTALRSISLHLNSGEFICIIGPSGCGKSTLLRLIADQLEPTTGFITLNSKSPGTMRRQKKIAWMAQSPALLPWKTVQENIQLSQMVNTDFNHPTLKHGDFLQLVDLSGFAQAYPGTLSGGMQQRVTLARTLAIGASLWLMDEPFAALDEFTRELLAHKVLTLWSRFGPTVIWVTHSIMEAVSIADRIIVMTHRPGEIKAEVTLQHPQPRDITHPYSISLVQQLRDLLKP